MFISNLQHNLQHIRCVRVCVRGRWECEDGCVCQGCVCVFLLSKYRAVAVTATKKAIMDSSVRNTDFVLISLCLCARFYCNVFSIVYPSGHVRLLSLFTLTAILNSVLRNERRKKLLHFTVCVYIWLGILLHFANAFYKVIKNEDEKI